MSGRALSWEGCVNVRDLGLLPAVGGYRTRTGVVVRADNVRRLSEAGWETALRFGVRRVVDLRFPGEEPGEPDVHAGVEVVAVSLFGKHDPYREAVFDERVRGGGDTAAVFAELYVDVLAEHGTRIAEAVTAVAESDGAVVVHCAAGKDRTGIVSALLLSLAGVPDDEVAADYALSGPNVARLFGGWVEEVTHDPAEHNLRTRLLQSPETAMRTMLGRLRELGGAETYLRSAGVEAAALGRLRARLTAVGAV